MASFIKDRLTNDAQKGLFDSIKKLKLSTFATLNKSFHVSVKDTYSESRHKSIWEDHGQARNIS